MTPERRRKGKTQLNQKRGCALRRSCAATAPRGAMASAGAAQPRDKQRLVKERRQTAAPEAKKLYGRSPVTSASPPPAWPRRCQRAQGQRAKASMASRAEDTTE